MAWTEAEYAQRGLGRMTLRVAQEVLRRLAALAALSKQERTEVISTLINKRYEEVFDGK